MARNDVVNRDGSINYDTIGGFKDRLDGHDSSLADIVTDVKSYGAKGDGSNDDTQAIQNAINAIVTTNGGKLLFPKGTYKITSSITIPFGTGFIIEGFSRGSVTLKQFTDNTPIFKFTAELTQDFCIRGITFDYANNQPNTNTLANSIYFELPSGTSTGAGMFNFTVENCSFIGGYYGIMQTQQAQQLPLWGVYVRSCRFSDYLSGGAVNIAPNPAIGQPIIKLENVYIHATNMSKILIGIYNSDTVILDSVEINSGSVSNGNPHLEIQTCSNITIINSRCEQVTVNGTAQVWDFAQSNVTIIGCSQTLVLAANAAATGLKAGTSGRISIHGFYITASIVGTGASGVAVTADDILILENLNIGNSVFSRYLSYSTQPRIDMMYVQPNKTKFQGDTSVTLTPSDFPIQYFNTTFTANRTITLPNSGLYDGMTFTIVKWNTASYTLTISDPLTGKSETIPASTKGAITYRAVNGSEWLPVQYSTFS